MLERRPCRLVSSVEVRKGAKFDESILKAITGGDAITAAAKYESDITFYATFALWLAGNDAPTIRDDDEGAWSRVRRIPFTNPLPKEKQDPNMRENLRGWVVQSAVLAWAVKGCLEWQKSGIGTCAAVEKSSAEYRSEMDRVAGFFAECCVFEDFEGSQVSRKRLREEYVAWCAENGIRTPVDAKKFAERLRELGATDGKNSGIRVWKRVRLLGPDEEPGSAGSPGDTIPRNFLMRDRTEKVSGEMSLRDPRVPDDDVERNAIQAEAGE